MIPAAAAASWVTQDTWTATLSLSTPPGALTVTPGASGTWVTDGYDFNGTGTANRTGFTPLHNVGAFTILVWFTPDTLTGAQMLASQYVDLNNRVEVYQENDDMQFRLGTGSAFIAMTLHNLLTAGRRYLAVMTWNKSVDSGKFTAYVYDLTVANTSTAVSSTGYTGNTTANAALNLGRRIPTALQFSGKIYGLQILARRITQTEAEAARLGFLTGTRWHWTMDEGTGTVFYANTPVWRYQDTWTASAPSSAPYQKTWKTMDSWGASIQVPVVQPDIAVFLPPWVGLLGIILLPVSLCYVPLRRRLTDTVSVNDFGTAALLFFIALALMIGSVI